MEGLTGLGMTRLSPTSKVASLSKCYSSKLVNFNGRLFFHNVQKICLGNNVMLHKFLNIYSIDNGPCASIEVLRVSTSSPKVSVISNVIPTSMKTKIWGMASSSMYCLEVE
jgi:hypothetical protein